MAEEPTKDDAKDKLRFFKDNQGGAQAEKQNGVDEKSQPQQPESQETKSEQAAPTLQEGGRAAGADKVPAKPKHQPIMPEVAPTIALAIKTLVILAIIIIDAFAAYYLSVEVIAPRVVQARVVSLQEKEKEVPEEKAPPPEEEVPPVGFITPIKDLVVNPAGTNGTRYLCTTVAFETHDQVVADEIKTREPQVRDLLIEILGGRTVEELSDLDNRVKIRKEIEDAINEMLVSGKVVGVYFSNFVLQ